MLPTLDDYQDSFMSGAHHLFMYSIHVCIACRLSTRRKPEIVSSNCLSGRLLFGRTTKAGMEGV